MKKNRAGKKKKSTQAKYIALPASLPSGLKKGRERGVKEKEEKRKSGGKCRENYI